MENIFGALVQVFSIQGILFIVTGVVFGMICGALPGLSSAMAIVLVLPFTYSMPPVSAIVMLVAVYVGGACGGSISAILLKTPGTPEAVATTFDGYPMAQRGGAGRALGIAVSSSSIGGIFFCRSDAFGGSHACLDSLEISEPRIFCFGPPGIELYNKHWIEKPDEGAFFGLCRIMACHHRHRFHKWNV